MRGLELGLDLLKQARSSSYYLEDESLKWVIVVIALHYRACEARSFAAVRERCSVFSAEANSHDGKQGNIYVYIVTNLFAAFRGRSEFTDCGLNEFPRTGGTSQGKESSLFHHVVVLAQDISAASSN